MIEPLRGRIMMPGPRIVAASEVHDHLDYESLIEALRQVFRQRAEAPEGHVYNVPMRGGLGDALLGIAPAWLVGRAIGVHIATDFIEPPPDAAGNTASYLLIDARTGAPRALIDATALTLRRIAGASALAASYLARPDCERLLILGTGAIVTQLIAAMRQVRPIRNVLIWSHDADDAARAAQRLTRNDLRVTVAADLQAAVTGAHIICCAEAAAEPLIKGAWLPSGAHLDLIAGPTPDLRKLDDEAITRARVFVDTQAACAYAADIAAPLASGILDMTDIAGDLYDMTRGDRAARRFYDQITLIQSAGSPIEDLAAAIRLMDALGE